MVLSDVFFVKMVLISLYNNLYRIKNKDYSTLRSAYLRYKHAEKADKNKDYGTYEKALHNAMRNGKFIGEVHGPFVYGLDNHFLLLIALL